MFCMWAPPFNLHQAPEPSSALWRARHWQQAGASGVYSESMPGFEKMNLTFRKGQSFSKSKNSTEEQD